jgi:hypothetical protein
MLTTGPRSVSLGLTMRGMTQRVAGDRDLRESDELVGTRNG